MAFMNGNNIVVTFIPLLFGGGGVNMGPDMTSYDQDIKQEPSMVRARIG